MAEEQNTPQEQSNPLTKYFRQPGITIELPSKYYFYKRKPKTNILNEIEVYPMTAQDELILKNPDNLLSGDAIEKVINSCAPNISNVRELLQPDIEALLLAIRAVSYGDEMEVSATCPECKTENDFSINIREKLEQMEYLDDKYEVPLNNDLVVELKPYDYEDTTKASILAFQEAKALDTASDTSLGEEVRKRKFQEAFQRLSELNMDLLVKSIHKIRTPDATVDKDEWIEEWVRQADRKDIKKIEDRVAEMNKTGADNKVKAKCQKCGHEWESEVTYDPANFFG
jgi:predicted Zn-ribbon and HTH transcriptional regulator